MNKKILYTILIVYLCFICVQIFIPIIHFQDNNNYITPSKDCYIDSSKPIANYGNSTKLITGGYSGKRILIEFDLKGIPENYLCSNLKINLQTDNYTEDVTIYYSDFKWDESMINYRDTPHFWDKLSVIEINPNNINYVIDTTEILRSHDKITMLIISNDLTGGDCVQIYSKESNSDEIPVKLEFIPTPFNLSIYILSLINVNLIFFILIVFLRYRRSNYVNLNLLDKVEAKEIHDNLYSKSDRPREFFERFKLSDSNIHKNNELNKNLKMKTNNTYSILPLKKEESKDKIKNPDIKEKKMYHKGIPYTFRWYDLKHSNFSSIINDKLKAYLSEIYYNEIKIINSKKYVTYSCSNFNVK